MIVRHHYEERRKRVLSALDRELSVEKRGLDESRDEAIARLEEFVSRYSGQQRRPARDAGRHVPPGRAVRREGARQDRLRSVDRARAGDRHVSPHHQGVPAVRGDRGRSLLPRPRLHGRRVASKRASRPGARWPAPRATRCRTTRRTPARSCCSRCRRITTISSGTTGTTRTRFRSIKPRPSARAVKRGADKLVDTEELTFADPYDGCKPLPQKIEPGEDPRYLAEIWWQLGNFHFDQIDPRGGPYNLNRAVVAYQQSMQYTKPPIYGVALYKLAWTFFKQQRYHTAVDNFVKLLGYADEQEAKTGDPGADFRQEAFTYIAGSLTYVDFDGPPPGASLHPAQRRARHRARSAARRREDGDRHHARPRPAADSTGQKVDGRDLQGARARVHRDHAEPQRRRDARAHAQEVPDGSRRARDAEQGRRAVRPALAPGAGRLGRARRVRLARRSRLAPSWPPTSAPRPGWTPTATIPRRSPPPSSSSRAASSAPPPITPTLRVPTRTRRSS